MKLIESSKQRIHTVIRECLALWYALCHPRVRWHAKIVVVLPIVYVISPIDLIPDVIPFVGQLDDLVVVRLSYGLLKKIIAPDVLEECRERANTFLGQKKKNKMKFVAVLSAIWILLTTLLVIYLMKKMIKHRVIPHR